MTLHAMFGYQNVVPGATLTALQPTVQGLDQTQLQNDQGDPSTAWRTPGTAASLVIDSGSDAQTWRAFLLARTNLSANATVRWRVGPAESVLEETPVLALDFTAGALPAGMTFTRTGAATYRTGTTLALAATGVPRFDYDTAGNCLGLVVEEGRTNLLPDSSGFASGWNTTANVTSTDVAPPLAGVLVKKSTPTTASNALSGYFSVTLAAIGTYRVSMYIWLPTGGVYTAGAYATTETAGVSSTQGAFDGTKTGQWQRVTYQITTTVANTSTNFLTRCSYPVGQSFYSACWQVEAGDYITSYIPSSGAAGVRNTDIPNLGFSAAYSASLSSFWEFMQPAASATEGNQGGIVISNSLGEIAYHYTVNNNTAVVLAVPNTGASRAGGFGLTPSATAVHRNAGSYGPLASNWYQDGGATTALAGAQFSQAMTTLNFFGSGSTIHRKIKLYLKALSANQLGYLTLTGSTIVGPTYEAVVASAGVQPGYQQSLTLAPSAVTGRYCRVDITDTNPDGFISVPLIHAGPVWSPLTNMSFDSSMGRNVQVDETQARGGGEFPAYRWAQRKWSVSLTGIRQSEIWPQVMDMERLTMSGGNALFIPYPDGTTNNMDTVFGRMKFTADLTFPYGAADRRSRTLTVTERL